MRSTTLFVSLFLIQVTVLGAEQSCGSFLGYASSQTAASKPDISTEAQFNAQLGLVVDAETLMSFIEVLKPKARKYSANDKKNFVRRGLVEIESLATSITDRIDHDTRLDILRIFIALRYNSVSVRFVKALERATIQDISTNDLNESDLEDSEALSSYIFVMSRLRLKPTSNFIKFVERQFISNPHLYSSNQLSSLMLGLTSLGVKPSALFLQSWQDRYIEVKSTFHSKNTANSLYAIYLLGSAEMVSWFVQNTAKEAWDKIDNEIERRQVAQVLEYFNKVHNISLQPIADFEGQFKALVRRRQGRPSVDEARLSQVLTTVGTDFVSEYQTDPGFIVDFYLPEHNQIIQVDGPSHFIKIMEKFRWIERRRPQDTLIDEVLTHYRYNVRRWHYNQPLDSFLKLR